MSKPRYHLKAGQAKGGPKVPIVLFVTIWLLMDRLNAPQWLWGIYWFLVLIINIIVIADGFKYDDEEVDISDFLEEKYNEQKKKA